MTGLSVDPDCIALDTANGCHDADGQVVEVPFRTTDPGAGRPVGVEGTQ